MILFLGLFSWMWLARVIRGEFLSLKQRDFVEAARSIGVPDGRIIVAASAAECGGRDHRLHDPQHRLRHAGRSDALVPRVRRPAGDADLGQHAQRGAAVLHHRAAPGDRPGLTLTIAVLAINFVGDGLRDALDPRGRG